VPDGLELFDHGEQVADRAGQLIEPHDPRFSQARLSRRGRATAGRLRSAPEACSSTMVVQPAARSSSS